VKPPGLAVDKLGGIPLHFPAARRPQRASKSDWAESKDLRLLLFPWRPGPQKWLLRTGWGDVM